MTTRQQYLEHFISTLGDELILTSVGASARELQALAPREGSLYRVHLGGTTSMAMGLALALPQRQVVAFEGDGGVLMGLSALPVVARQQPSNLLVIVFDNGLYEGGGRLPTITAQGTDIVAIAKGAGITDAVRVSGVDAFATALAESRASGGTGYIVAETVPGSQQPYDPMDGTENKYRFIHHIESTEGVQVLQGPGRSSVR
jgi:thiamine pyrophosphate-dependent acetolactate synthase large subunit-like protein